MTKGEVLEGDWGITGRGRHVGIARGRGRVMGRGRGMGKEREIERMIVF